MSQISADFETGVDTNTISTGDTGSATAWDVVDPTAATYSTTHVAHGSLAGKFTTGDLGWTTAFGTQTDFYGRAYIYLTANPATRFSIVYHTKGGGSSRITIETDGKVSFCNAGSAVITTTASVNLNAWTRIEYHLVNSTTVGVYELKLFLTPDSSSADETQTATGQNTGVSSTDAYFGNCTTIAGNADFWLDDIITNAASYPGPAGAGAPSYYDITAAAEVDSAPFISIADDLVLGNATGTSGPDALGTQYLYVSGEAAGSGYLAASSGVISKVTVKLDAPVTGTVVVRAVVYRETAGLPAALVCYTDTRSFSAGDPEAEYDFTGLHGTPVITAGERYWIGVYTVSQTSAGLRYPWNSAGNGITKYIGAVSDPPPDPFPATPGSDFGQLWAYITYTLAAGSYDLAPVDEIDAVLDLTAGIHRVPHIAAAGLTYLFGDAGNFATLVNAAETDTALALQVSHPFAATITPVVETDAARPLTLALPAHQTITSASESDAAVPLALTHEIALNISLPLGYGLSDLYGRVVVCDLPSGYWRTDSLADEMERNNLTAVGSPGLVAGLISYGQARSLGGSDAFTVTADPVYDEVRSLECWYEPGSVSGAQTLISKGTNAYQLRTNDDALELWKQDEGLIVSSSGLTLQVGGAYHIVATASGALYVNGADVSGAVTARSFASTLTDLNIGRKSDGTEYVSGTLDEVAVYPYEPTLDMAAMHYQAGLGNFGRNHFDSADYPAMAVEIAFDSAWNDPYPLWENVTEDLRATGVSIDGSGRPDETQRSSPSAAQLTLDNLERDFDPTNTAGAYGDRILPMRPTRIRFAWDTLYWGFRGWADEWTVNELSFGFDSTTTIACVDLYAAFANFEFDEANTLLLEQLAGARLEACCDLLGIPSNQRNIDAGLSVMPELERPTGKILDHMLAVAESDGGFLYNGPDGRLVYEDRRARVGMPVLETFGDEAPELPYSGIERSSNTAYLFNRAVITPGDGNEAAVAEDAASLAEFPPLTYTKSVLTGFNEAQAAAEWYVARYKDPAVRFLSIDVNGGSDPDALWPVILGTVNSYRYRIRRRPPGGGTMELDEYVERIAHRITNAGWIVTWSLSPFGDEDLWPLDNPAFILGDNTYPTW